MRWVLFWALLSLGCLLAAPATALAADHATAPQAELDDQPSKFSLMPPLPFASPQVAPVIPPDDQDRDDQDRDDQDRDDQDRDDEDDVDQRTTAFVPQDLSMLTEIDMPEDEARWIRVDLSEQLVIAYEDGQPIRAFRVSTGMPRTPTVTGDFRIRMKVRSQTMVGGSPELGTYYNLPNVQWVQYFYADYGFHGTYWHNNFGEPMSHGCINMTNADAKWLFDWAGPEWDGSTVWYPPSEDNPGTRVIVHE